MIKLKPTTKFVLEAFIPYSRANFAISFSPSLFFRELEKRSGYKKRSLESAYYRLVQKELIEIDDKGIPRLTERGLASVKTFKPIKLKHDAKLMVIFDIPEEERWKRTRLRTLLKELSFRQVQKSVWESRYDYREYLRAEIAEMQLQEYVAVYEVAQIEV